MPRARAGRCRFAQGYAGAMSESSDDTAARILAVVRAIPAGQVAGYGEVARLAGLPGRARLAARVLARNADPDLPWHRVLRADGSVAFPEGSAGYLEQCQRLRSEGVDMQGGRVRMRPRAGRSLDAVLWGPTDS